MEYYIRPSAQVHNIFIEDQVCKKTFMNTWGISKNKMKVLKAICAVY